MRDEVIFKFDESETIGTVIAVDSARVTIMVTNIGVVPRLGIGNLTSINGGTGAEQLIGLIERVTRGLVEQPAEGKPDDPEIPFLITPGDMIRVTLIGTFRTADGT